MFRVLRELIPPFIFKIFRLVKPRYSFGGHYASWQDAAEASGGYDTDVIMNKVKAALLKVKNGEAVYERDSVLFDKVEYSWPLLAGLLWIASRNGNILNLVDFGGALGSSYYQNRQFLGHLSMLRWNIVEQKGFVDCGKHFFENEHLKFYYNLNDCLREQQPDAIILSSVLQYLEKPYDLLREIMNRRINYLVIDRTAFIETVDDLITIQKVAEEIYQASYPAWFFSERKFLQFLSSTYELTADFESTDRANIPSVFKGYIFKLKNDA